MGGGSVGSGKVSRKAFGDYKEILVKALSGLRTISEADSATTEELREVASTTLKEVRRMEDMFLNRKARGLDI